MYTYWTYINADTISNRHQNGTNKYVKLTRCKYALETGRNNCRKVTDANNAFESKCLSHYQTHRHRNVAEMKILGRH